MHPSSRNLSGVRANTSRANAGREWCRGPISQKAGTGGHGGRRGWSTGWRKTPDFQLRVGSLNGARSQLNKSSSCGVQSAAILKSKNWKNFALSSRAGFKNSKRSKTLHPLGNDAGSRSSADRTLRRPRCGHFVSRCSDFHRHALRLREVRGGGRRDRCVTKEAASLFKAML